jgi:hypothetical protein
VLTALRNVSAITMSRHSPASQSEKNHRKQMG